MMTHPEEEIQPALQKLTKTKHSGKPERNESFKGNHGI
jgi:hypothetical protein